MTSRVDRIPLFARWRMRVPAPGEGLRFLIVGGLAYFVSQFCLFVLYDLVPFLPDKGRAVDLLFFTHPDGRRLLIAAMTLAFTVSPYVSNTLGALGGVAVNWAFSAYLVWRHAPADRAVGNRRSR